MSQIIDNKAQNVGYELWNTRFDITNYADVCINMYVRISEDVVQIFFHDFNIASKQINAQMNAQKSKCLRNLIGAIDATWR